MICKLSITAASALILVVATRGDGGALGGDAAVFVVPPSSTMANPDPAVRACVGCGLSQSDQNLCANCSFSIAWGGGNSGGDCQQVLNCGPTATPCSIGGFTATITATSPGCKLEQWDPDAQQWGLPFTLSSGQISIDRGDAANPTPLNCGQHMTVFRCGASIASANCNECKKP